MFCYGTFSWSMFPKKIKGIFGFVICAGGGEIENQVQDPQVVICYRRVIQNFYNACVADGGGVLLQSALCTFLFDHYGGEDLVYRHFPELRLANKGEAIKQLLYRSNLLVKNSSSRRTCNMDGEALPISVNLKCVEHTSKFMFMFRPLLPSFLYCYEQLCLETADGQS